MVEERGSREEREGRREERKGELERVAATIVDAALKVHKTLGPGLLESVYEQCLAHEIAKRGLRFARQPALAVIYDGEQIEAGYRLDLLVEDCVVVEIKSVETLTPLHQAQVLTYLKLSGLPLGFLINFNSPTLKQGLKRYVRSST
jgi:GxxExxY protein